jgi:hypothetical protein
MKSKINKLEMQILADELDDEVRTLELEIAEKTENLKIKKVYAEAARAVFLGLSYGGIK